MTVFYCQISAKYCCVQYIVFTSFAWGGGMYCCIHTHVTAIYNSTKYCCVQYIVFTSFAWGGGMYCCIHTHVTAIYNSTKYCCMHFCFYKFSLCTCIYVTYYCQSCFTIAKSVLLLSKLCSIVFYNGMR